MIKSWHIIKTYAANAVSVIQRDNYRPPVSAEAITEMEFRKGCAEIDVHFVSDGISQTETIDAAPILTAMLNEMIGDR